MYYLENDLALENYSIRRLFITPGGFLKLYTAEIEQSNLKSNIDHNHSSYYRVLRWMGRENSKELILSPEQLDCLKRK